MKSVRIAAAVVPLPPSPVGSVHSVNVLSPLLRHSTFGASPGFKRRARQKQIQIAIVVVIDERDAGRLVARREPGFRRHVLELAVAQVAKQQHPVVERDGQVVQPSPS